MKRATSLVIVLGAAAIAACFSKPDAPNAQDDAHTTDGRTIDGAVDPDARMLDAPPGSCSPIQDNFNGSNANPCAGWGTFGGAGTHTGTHSGATLALTGGMLGAYATCTSQGFKMDAGTSIQIVQPAQGGGSSKTWFALSLYNPTSRFEFSITQGSANLYLILGCPAGSTNTAQVASVAPPWVRFVTSNTTANHQAGTVTVNLQTSNDATSASPTWTTFQSCVVTGQADGSGFVEMGGSAGSNQPATAIFDNFNIYPCAPP